MVSSSFSVNLYEKIRMKPAKTENGSEEKKLVLDCRNLDHWTQFIVLLKIIQ